MKKIEQNKLRNEETYEHLNTRIDHNEEYITSTLKDMKRIFDELIADNKNFKNFITEEYIEFFKSKKRIRQEWSIHTNQVNARIDSYIDTLTNYDKKISSLNTVLPILVELTCLVEKFTQEDIQVRHRLAQGLRLDHLPSGGYLRTEKTR